MEEEGRGKSLTWNEGKWRQQRGELVLRVGVSVLELLTENSRLDTQQRI